MNHSKDIVVRTESPMEIYGSIAAAKARLLTWAEESDARRGTTGRRVTALATTGIFALIGGVLIARVVTSRRTSLARGWMRTVAATFIFRALMARVQQHILTRTVRRVTPYGRSAQAQS